MSVKPIEFEFASYTADLAGKKLSFSYIIHFDGREPLEFTERLELPTRLDSARQAGFDANVPPKLLANIMEGLHLMLGISYYKLYIPSKFKLPYQLSRKQAEFWNTVYRKGLGEFLYRNALDPKQLAQFIATTGENITAAPFPRQDRVLSTIGGGKDSIVATELLKEGKFKTTTLYMQTQKPNEQVTTLLQAFKLPNLTIERYLDEKIFQKHPDSYNGHIPVSAIFAFIGTLVGILYDHRYVVVANERSSNFGNIEYHGEVVNHQWSKSQEFETLFQEYARHYITPDVIYFSLLRHSNEIRIAKLFAEYPRYFKLFSSCNRVAKISSLHHSEQSEESNIRSFGKPQDDRKWCNACPKCAFAFAILSPFIAKKELLKIFGKDLLADPALAQTFANISGQGAMKPFDCVGTFEEVTVALRLARGHSERSEESTAVLQTHPAPGIPAQFAFLGMKTAIILGYGTEGQATKEYLKKHYPKLKIAIGDKKNDRTKDKNYLAKQNAYDIAIKTPGMPKELVKIFYTTATNIFLSALPPEAITIGVTGSKGKSTTASLIYAILTEAKKKAVLLGNIGQPMLSYTPNSYELAHKMIYVLELSSYMLDDIQSSPQIAVVTNLFPDHMNYHGSLQKYYDAKRNIIRYQKKSDFFVFNPKPLELGEWVKESTATPVPYLPTGQAGQTDIPVKDSEIPLLGAHNRDNIRAALTVAKLLDIPEEVSASAIKKFKHLPHRLEFVDQFKGIKFYDDANATTPEATIAALQALPETETIFLGGEDRGYDFTELAKALHASHVKNIVLFPASGATILKHLRKSDFVILQTKSMKAAVQFAYQHTEPGKIALLSMASPSYSLWKNFEEKGTEYQKFVKNLSLRGTPRQSRKN